MPVARRCEKCNKPFTAKPFHIRKGHGRFCSRRCNFDAMKTGELRACDTCGKATYKTPKQIRVSKNKKYFCSKTCQTIWRNGIFIGPRHASWKHGKNAYQSVLRRIGRKEICQLCQTSDARVLATHHIDKDKTNNKPENLAWLCHNCHFLVHHYSEGRDQGLLKPRS